MKILKYIADDKTNELMLSNDDLGSFLGRLIAGQTELSKRICFGVDEESISELQLQLTDFDPNLTISINGKDIQKGESVEVHSGVLTPGQVSNTVFLTVKANKEIQVAEGKQHKIGLKLSYLYPGR
jgi:hypothetical protein